MRDRGASQMEQRVRGAAHLCLHQGAARQRQEWQHHQQPVYPRTRACAQRTRGLRPTAHQNLRTEHRASGTGAFGGGERGIQRLLRREQRNHQRGISRLHDMETVGGATCGKSGEGKCGARQPLRIQAEVLLSQQPHNRRHQSSDRNVDRHR